ncbi:TPA: hypothetical protein DCE37_04890 [Candidatus Latescibacteria bacterium]|nr:hypothetical protein [Candidatus Latescibacterota bacterium]
MGRFWLVFPLITVIAAYALFSRDPEPEQAPRARFSASRDIKVEVLNGCGVDGMARTVGNRLRDTGFDVMTLDNADRFDYPESIVIDRLGKPSEAVKVAEALGISNQIQQIVPDQFRIESVTVIVGKDFGRIGLDQQVPPRTITARVSNL